MARKVVRRGPNSAPKTKKLLLKVDLECYEKFADEFMMNITQERNKVSCWLNDVVEESKEFILGNSAICVFDSSLLSSFASSFYPQNTIDSILSDVSAAYTPMKESKQRLNCIPEEPPLVATPIKRKLFEHESFAANKGPNSDFNPVNIKNTPKSNLPTPTFKSLRSRVVKYPPSAVKRDHSYLKNSRLENSSQSVLDEKIFKGERAHQFVSQAVEERKRAIKEKNEMRLKATQLRRRQAEEARLQKIEAEEARKRVAKTKIMEALKKKPRNDINVSRNLYPINQKANKMEGFKKILNGKPTISVSKKETVFTSTPYSRNANWEKNEDLSDVVHDDPNLFPIKVLDVNQETDSTRGRRGTFDLTKGLTNHNSISQGYDMTAPLSSNFSSDSSDLSDFGKNNKFRPAWASNAEVIKSMTIQNTLSNKDVDEIFGRIPEVKMREIFPESLKNFNRRTSSGIWET